MRGQSRDWHFLYSGKSRLPLIWQCVLSLQSDTEKLIQETPNLDWYLQIQRKKTNNKTNITQTKLSPWTKQNKFSVHCTVWLQPRNQNLFNICELAYIIISLHANISAFLNRRISKDLKSNNLNKTENRVLFVFLDHQ